MELLSLFFNLLLVCLGLAIILRRKEKSLKLPPGPRPLPLIGNLLELGDEPHKSLANLSKTYGPIMSLKLGQKTACVISSPTLAKEAFQRQERVFSTRSIPNALQGHDHFKYSVVWMAASDRWKSLRKIINTVLLQTNKLNATRNLRREKVNELISYAKKCCDEGVVVDIGRAAFTTSLNMMSNTMFSMDVADGLSNEIRDEIYNIMMNSVKPNLPDFFPILGNIDLQGLRSLMTNSFENMFKIVRKLIDERIESRRLKKNNDVNDVLETLLNMGEDISKTQIERLLTDLFIAGTATTSSTIEWVMAELLKNPKILKTAKMELENTIGIGKTIEESDVANLPYLRAIVKETLRKHPPDPFTSRIVEIDVEISEYTIPKGTQVLVNLWAMGRDPILWENPTSFEPERFMGSDIDVKGLNLELIPFGLGIRSCPGIPLASRTIPVMVGSLLNMFDWKIEGGIIPEELNMEEKFGFTITKAQPLSVVPITI